MFTPSLQQIRAAMGIKNYTVFQNPGKYDLNIVGIRSNELRAGQFDDFITVFYRTKVEWAFFAFPATTDPGAYYLDNPLNVEGTAILVPGRYRSAFKIGKHRNKYFALVQARRVSVYRDSDRDEVLDTQEDKIRTGMFGINIHRASSRMASERVGKFSAGCQVFQDPDHFDLFIRLCRKSESYLGPTFSYTLLTEDDIV